MMKIYCNICNKYRKFKNLKILYLFRKYWVFLFPIASSKCDHEYKIIFNTIQDGSFWGLSRKVCQKDPASP